MFWETFIPILYFGFYNYFETALANVSIRTKQVIKITIYKILIRYFGLEEQTTLQSSPDTLDKTKLLLLGVIEKVHILQISEVCRLISLTRS